MNCKRLISLLLVICVLFSLYSCDSCNGNPEETTEEPWFETTGDFIVEDSKTDYKIVTTENREPDEETAVLWLQQRLKESTDIDFPVIKDSEIATLTDSDKYIFVGNNKFTQEKGVVADATVLYRSGYVIKTVGNSIFILGTTPTSTIFGVTRFLENVVNYDYYYKNIWSIDKGVKEIPLYNYSLEFKPDNEFSWLEAPYLSATDQKLLSMYARKLSSVNGTIGHNSIFWLPMAEFNDESKSETYHPKWYMEAVGQDQTQLCYTAHGDADEYAKMVEQMRVELTDEMKEDDTAYFFSCTISDDYNWCECDACKAAEERYGAQSALVVRLLNDVAEAVDAWFETADGAPYKRNWYVCFYAYYGCTDAPAKYDEATDSFTANDESVFCNDHVVPQVADILNADYTSSFDSEVNYETSQNFRAWDYLSSMMATYLYSANYWHALLPFDNLSVMQSWYKGLVGNQMYFHDHVSEMSYATGWSALRIYLASKLGKDVDVNVEELVEKFFENVYLDASEPMMKLYNEWRAHEALCKAEGNAYAGKMSHYSSKPLQSKFFSATMLKNWLGYIDEALDSIEYLNQNGDAAYESTKKMIIGERIFVNYILYRVYRYDRVNLPADEYNNVKTELSQDLRYTKTNYTGQKDYNTVDDFIENMMGE